MTKRRTTTPAPGTFAARRAEREERERLHGIPPRRRLTLRAGDDQAENDVTITASNDDDYGSPA